MNNISYRLSWYGCDLSSYQILHVSLATVITQETKHIFHATTMLLYITQINILKNP